MSCSHSLCQLADTSITSSLGWAQLTSITLKLNLFSSFDLKADTYKPHFQRNIEILKAFSCLQNLQEVTLALLFNDHRGLLIVVLPPLTEVCPELEKALIMFPSPMLSFSYLYENDISNHRRCHSWLHIIGKFFPVLAERGALKLNTTLCKSYSTIYTQMSSC